MALDSSWSWAGPGAWSWSNGSKKCFLREPPPAARMSLSFLARLFKVSFLGHHLGIFFFAFSYQFGLNLAPTWRHLGPNLAPSWPFLAPFWGQVGPKLVPTWSFCKSRCLLDAILPTCQKLHKNQWFFNDFGGFQPAYLVPNLHIFRPTWTNLGHLKPT